MATKHPIWNGFDKKSIPNITIRSGDNIDSRRPALEFDPNIDIETSEYLNKFACGLTYLDFQSWEYYAPIYMTHIIQIKGDDLDVASQCFLKTIDLKKYNIKFIQNLSAKQKKTILNFLKMLLKKNHSYYLEDLVYDWESIDEWIDSISAD